MSQIKLKCDFRDTEIAAAFSDPTPVIKAMEVSTLRTVRDGAKVLIPSFNVLNDLIVAAGVKEFHGVPILDTGGISLKAAEFLVDARNAGLVEKAA